MAALIGVLVAIGWLLLGNGGGTTYKLVFDTAGQLVKGNQVQVGGSPIGEVKKIELADNSQAEVTIETDQTLHEGTTAVIRATSLSGVANHYISLTPGPNNLPELGDDAVIAADKTTSPVELDQLFNTLDEPTRKGLQDFIQGSAAAYTGVGEEANESYRYLSPSLVATDKLLQELGRDEQVLSDFLVDSSRVVTAIAERRTDLAQLIPNTNKAFAAVASENRSLDQALRELPPALRQANTTFFNLRDALDDLDSFVATSKTATVGLAPFLKALRPVTKKSVPVFSNLSHAVRRKKKNNDLADAVGHLPQIELKAASAMGPAIAAMASAQPVLEFARPYMPDLLGLITKLGQITAPYDADGHYARVQPAGLGLFCYDDGTQAAPCNTGSGGLEPIPDTRQFDNLDFGIFRRCPGGASQASVDGSSPFLDGGNLISPADCNVTDVPPGP